MSFQSDGRKSCLSDVSAGRSIHGFRYESCEDLPEIDGLAHILRHDATGARLLYLENEDENKGFAITFKTPPENDTGVFHILEHSVLCGSRRFPVKEPFVNLLRTSMQTFLNAMTFPDKTMYPVASTNEQDLLNLMDVYLDAVLDPAIYAKREIFEQEGWHFELDALDEPLRYNGVVFNEMKGALSDPDDVLYHAVNAALFPDTCYAFESGGNPRSIPQLSYEGFLESHARYYRLDNSYTVLYGDMDIDRVLAFLDDRFMAAPEPEQLLASAEALDEAPALKPAAEISAQEPFDAGHVCVPMNTTPDNACVGLGYVIGMASDYERVLAVDVLLDALMGGNESPIKRALLDADLGGDATAFLIDSQLQPVALFQLKNAKPGAAQRFREIVEEQVRALVTDGIPRDLLEASLAQLAFMLRERDRGIADGVALAMSSMSGWLYDEQGATMYLRYEEVVAHLREGLDTGLFERILESLVLDSRHCALVEVVPEPSDGESAEAAELADIKAGMDENRLKAVMADVERLRIHQETPDSAEALATLPQLHVSDIGPAKPDPRPCAFSAAPLPCVLHELPTRHIDYACFYFDLGHMSWEDMPYVTIVALLLSQLDTAERSAADLDVHMRSHLGSLRFFSEAYTPVDRPDDVELNMVVSASALSEELEHLVSIPREVWADTRFDDAGKIKDILVQRRVSMEQSFVNEGNSRGVARVLSYHSRAGVLREAMSGVDFYLFLKELIDNFDERAESLCAKLSDVARAMFSGAAMVSFVGSREDCEKFWELGGSFGLDAALSSASPFASMVASLDGVTAEDAGASGVSSAVEGDGGAPSEDTAFPRGLRIPESIARNEAFIVPSDVCYVVTGASGRDAGASYSGVWPVVTKALSYDYLWNEVRVKGGAYGCGFRLTPTNAMAFHSYRDPAVDPTLDRFSKAGAWLAGFEPDAEEMEGYIVSTVAAHDAPVKPRQIARRQDCDMLRGCDPDRREVLREEELSVTPEKMRACAAALDAMASCAHVCVFGNGDAIRASETAFEVTELMGS